MQQQQNAQVREPVPAATVVLARQADPGDGIEVLLLRRSARLVFHGGHWVFPGGRIDSGDFGGEAEAGQLYSAARKAAIRETREETGLEIDADQLIHVGHWTTPPGLPRRFSTWFFVCPVSRQARVKIDQDEITDYRWLSPRQALQDAREEKLVLPRPTRVTLSDIGVYENLADLEQGLRNCRIRVFPPDSDHYRPAEMGCPAKAG
ncbi:MAG: NUDIX hydrolase [Gammaproteobacteria bacterium]|nr:NUDIX hydrolase [Gammaproteobacteria bacterium]MYH46472.1 NUDIX hydrolase [Gammaproteobacteria bacterium]MYL14419.1 NUDIX hydrolase [Gammaproteobacteria bacterium]